MEEIEIIKSKNFLNKEDLKTILGSEATDHMVKKYFQEIHKIAIEELEKKGMIIPNKKLIPATYVWRYLKSYGIEK